MVTNDPKISESTPPPPTNNHFAVVSHVIRGRSDSTLSCLHSRLTDEALSESWLDSWQRERKRWQTTRELFILLRSSTVIYSQCAAQIKLYEVSRSGTQILPPRGTVNDLNKKAIYSAPIWEWQEKHQVSGWVWWLLQSAEVESQVCESSRQKHCLPRALIHLNRTQRRPSEQANSEKGIVGKLKIQLPSDCAMTSGYRPRGTEISTFKRCLHSSAHCALFMIAEIWKPFKYHQWRLNFLNV